MDCIYVLIALIHVAAGLVYGYIIWYFLEVVDAYARGLDT